MGVGAGRGRSTGQVAKLGLQATYRAVGPRAAADELCELSKA